MALFTAKEKKPITKLLSFAVNQDDCLSLEGVHGFLFGLAIIPEPIMPSEWLPGIFGEEMLELPSEKEGDLLFGGLFEAYNRITALSNDEKLEFPFDIGKLKSGDIQRVREWTHGFFLATSLRSEIWGFDDEEELDELDEFSPDSGDEEDYDEDDEEIAASFSIIMGVAFPEKLPEIFDHDEGEIVPFSKDDPDQEAKLFMMLPQAVEVIQEYAYAVRDGMRSMRPDNYPASP